MSETTTIITIDVEDWYHSSLDLFTDSTVLHGSKPDASVVANTLSTLELLEKTKSRATFFVLGTVAEHYPDVVREILKRGHEVGCHGYAHKLVYNITRGEFEKDVNLCLEHLAKAGCSRVLGYRAPYWSITKKSLWALEILEKMGFKYDSSVFPIRRGLYGIADADPMVHQISKGFWEFPPATIRLFGMNWPVAGGGYLRMVPYRLIHRAVRKAAVGTISVFYFHPYELDPFDVHLKHKVRSVHSMAYWLQQVIGRGGNPEKLRRLLSDFNFASIEQVLSHLLTRQERDGYADHRYNRRR